MSLDRPARSKKLSARHGLGNRRVFFAVATAAMVSLGGVSLTATAAQAGTISVVNGNFSSGTTGWEGGKNTSLTPTAAGRNGTAGTRMSNASSTAATVTLNDRVNSASGLIVGHTYQATAWVRTEDAGQAVILRLLEEDSSLTVVNSEQSYQWRSDTAWKQITTSYTATRTSTSLDVNVVGSRLAPGGAVVVDDVTLVDTTATPPTPAPAPAPAPTPVAAPAGWSLAWADEFNGTAINRDAWNVDNNSTYGDGNNELACLMDRPENVKVSGGLLTVTARKEATPIKCKDNDTRFPNGRSYTSGMLTTKNKVDFEYGRFEISAKTPLAQGTSKGLWPAFWLRPTTGGIGELDILEAIGTGKGDAFSANHVVQTIHYDYVGTHSKQGTGYDLPVGTTADGFHNYAVEWAPGSITWFVDGVKTYERSLSTTSWIDQAFVNEFYIRLNLAVGGNWPGSPTAETVFPAAFEVDYVRVYQR
ncbi:glycosyl hydrolase family protein [Cryobacterium sp. TMT1-19]|nr:glycosyl hydrolase family protein [Cryobacterium sp. TMT1-19]